MSVTFSLATESRIPSPWEKSEEPTEAEMDAYYAALDAMGEFNVANGNAGYILRDLLGLVGSFDDICYGSMDGADFRFRVSMIDQMSVIGGLAPTTQEGNSIDCGRTVAQCDRYLASLVRLARLSEEHDCGITWG